jgi:hypothetical protein
MLDVNEKENFGAFQSRLCHNVDAILLAFEQIDEVLLREELDGIAFDRLGQFGEEELKELDEERRQQFLEEAVVIYSKHDARFR